MALLTKQGDGDNPNLRCLVPKRSFVHFPNTFFGQHFHTMNTLLTYCQLGAQLAETWETN